MTGRSLPGIRRPRRGRYSPRLYPDVAAKTSIRPGIGPSDLRPAPRTDSLTAIRDDSVHDATKGATMARKRTMNRMNMRGEFEEGEERPEGEEAAETEE